MDYELYEQSGSDIIRQLGKQFSDYRKRRGYSQKTAEKTILMETNAVMVKLWGMPVGYISWNKKSEVAIFEYEPEFLDKGLDIAPLTMSINAPQSKKQIPWTGDKDKLYMGLPPVFADALPDKWGQSLFRAWLRDNHIQTQKVNPVDHLSFIGSRSMGALEYEPAQKLGGNDVFSVDVERLYAFGCRNKYNAIRITLIRKCNIFPHPSIRSHGQ